MTERDLHQLEQQVSSTSAAVAEADALARWRGKAAKRKGDAGEDVAEAWLRERYEMVRKIHTEWVPIRKNGRVTGGYPKRKVMADYAAIEPGTGRSVLVEVKRRQHLRLVHSDIKEHQREALTENAACGGISLLLWVRRGAVRCYDWAELLRDGFEPGKSITWR